jgi:hypothetical protein
LEHEGFCKHRLKAAISMGWRYRLGNGHESLLLTRPKWQLRDCPPGSSRRPVKRAAIASTAASREPPLRTEENL